MSVFFYVLRTEFMLKYKVVKNRGGERHADQRRDTENDAGVNL